MAGNILRGSFDTCVKAVAPAGRARHLLRMGLEANSIAHWRGETGTVRLHLDSRALELRGDLHLDIPRVAIGAPRAEGACLCLTAWGEPMRIELPEGGAARWAKALLKPVPTLAGKLGIGPDRPAWLVGETGDDALLAALEGARAPSADDAHLLVAVVGTVADLEVPATLAGSRPLWVVTGKGRHATVREGALRAWLREAGFGDSKSCAVSDTLTATRWQRRTR